MANSLVLLTKRSKALADALPCRREDPRLWFSDLPIDLQLAKGYCRSCPVRNSCLAGAVERHEPHGVWGGEIFTRGTIIAERGRGADRAARLRPSSELKPPSCRGARRPYPRRPSGSSWPGSPRSPCTPYAVGSRHSESSVP